MDPSKIRQKVRSLPANAGKTTILQRPGIYNMAGEEVRSIILRGEHDIENEMVFQSNPGFVFHDSCGRSKRPNVKDRIHVIW
ncbi:hypothetical protein DFH29DRAFT_924062 [Suillus ampliporus]|nr:hypothetical protein DFH29DRAFT_924062 [Suillus ampliporus]